MNKSLKTSIVLLSGSIFGLCTNSYAKAVIKSLSAYTTKKGTKTRATAESNLSKLNILTFQPTHTPQGRLQSIKKACKAIERGRSLQNSNTYVIINGNPYNLSCQLPALHKGTICVFVSGYSGKMSGSLYKYKGSGAYATHRHILKGFMSDKIWISFDGPVSYLRTFNFGQELDQSCLHEIYTQITERNPEASIVFVGLCKGATTILNYLNNPIYKSSFNNVKAIVLESPLVSFETCTKKIARTKLPRPLGKLLPGFFKTIFPNYIWNRPTIIDDASNFPKHIKAFIGCSHYDSTAPYQDARKIMSQLKKLSVTVELFEQHDKAIKHGHLAKVPAYQEKVENFLRVA